MKYQFLTDQKPQPGTPSVITIGNFDGVHKGHHTIFRKVEQVASQADANAIAFSFYPHPREVLGNVRVALLTTVDQRAAKISTLFPCMQYGKIHFDTALSQKSARDFLQILMGEFHMTDLVVGTTTHIGKNREGTPARLVELSQELKFSLHLVDPLEIDGRTVSSSLIRNLIIKGDVDKVEEVMGEHFSTTGEVIQGNRIGSSLGFPTANLACFSSQLLPANGVYAVWAYLNGKKYPAAVNLGYRPTLGDGDVERHLEVHLIEQDMDLYEKTLTIQWIMKMRDEKKFNSLEELRKQIGQDVTNIIKILDK